MVSIALEYMDKMGYKNTQFIIARHHDTNHPHIHLVINRIDNDDKRISDKNEKFRSTKVCMELTKKYGLYIAKGKENVNRYRLKEPDKTKYDIYDSIKAALPKCRNWQELTTELRRQSIVTAFRKNGNTDKIQGIRFGKGDYTFNGSQIDRSCSFSKIDFQLKQNEKAHNFNIQQEHNHSQNQSSVLENVGSALGGLFDIPLSSGLDTTAFEAAVERLDSAIEEVKIKENDLKYRYINMQGPTNEENLYRLEQKFQYVDSIKIIRKQVERYEELVKEQVERIERTNQNNKQVERLHKESKSLKNK